MFSHIVVGSNDLERSRRFYDAVFGAIGGPAGFIDDKGRLVYLKDGRVFVVTRPIDGEQACHANGGTIGFTMATPQTVDAWQQAAVAHGGKAIEEPAGIREAPGRTMYLAYVRDPDGNKLCGVHIVTA